MPNRVESPTRRYSLARRACPLFLFASLVYLVGCSGAPSNQITGKVTVEGKPVMGSVLFIGADGKKLGPVPISPKDGSYTLVNAPIGKGKFLVEGMASGAGVGGQKPPNTAKIKDGPMIDEAVPPPPEYADPANAIPYDYPGGKQTFDMPLTKKKKS